MRIVIVGVGGQGILFSSKVLGEIALRRGEKVVGSEVHGMSQRGGSVISHFKSGDHFGPLVQVGDADVVLAFDTDEAIRNVSFLRPGGTLIVNCDDPARFEAGAMGEYLRDKDIKVLPVDGYGILRERMRGRFLFLNVMILGALVASDSSGLSMEDMESAVADLSPERFRDDNLKALNLGFER
ncbi:2-oxoacid:acceptor oxidoreductase family protein [Dethiosulfovibrio sp. F2B]|uniref:2-oxoacid:acceptor oxidoreductase family protein n=1 Tax=Dethiosulfovibrio faecalis TaxID=2720018 RepID=UPI001F241EBA|nr:2-oxoacid:acceptor oxidoreductase family protein [Dethiosulfovibrio faecalis]MCF4152527.1 2-oxoacid:acceptor oxidoreductase family protein [Dethiosulfovibrio faecalis]